MEGEQFIKDNIPHVRIKLYRGKITLEFPLHNFSDYFSVFFLKSFELQEIVELTGSDRTFKGPNILAYTAQKKMLQ